MQMALSLRLATSDPQSLPAEQAELEKRLEGLAKGVDNLAALFPRPAENFQVGVSEAMLFANNQPLQTALPDGNGKLVTRMMQLTALANRAASAVRKPLS